jgi:hypothetical protein
VLVINFFKKYVPLLAQAPDTALVSEGRKWIQDTSSGMSFFSSRLLITLWVMIGWQTAPINSLCGRKVWLVTVKTGGTHVALTLYSPYIDSCFHPLSVGQMKEKAEAALLGNSSHPSPGRSSAAFRLSLSLSLSEHIWLPGPPTVCLTFHYRLLTIHTRVTTSLLWLLWTMLLCYYGY